MRIGSPDFAAEQDQLGGSIMDIFKEPDFSKTMPGGQQVYFGYNYQYGKH